MRSPVSTCSELILFECALQGAVSVGFVGGSVLPAVPDDVEPGAGQDADGVGVIVSSGSGSVVEVGGPGVGVAGVSGEVADGVAQLFVDRVAEADNLEFAGSTPRTWDGVLGSVVRHDRKWCGCARVVVAFGSW